MEFLEMFPLDPLVQLPGTYESPEYLTDYIAVAAEECSGSYSQGSSSPETHLSTDDANFDLIDLPQVNEDTVKEIVNEFVYEDPSYGSVTIDDISDIFKDYEDPDTCNVFIEENFVNLEPTHTTLETHTRRKQRIVPMASQPFEYGCEDQPNSGMVHRANLNCRKRSRDVNDAKYNENKIRVVSPGINDVKEMICQKYEEKEHSNLHSFKTIKDASTPSSPSNDEPNVTVTPGMRFRKRGLTHDERKERKKQSNRNASYRYRQRKKEEMDNFMQNSAEIFDSLEKEKEAYYNVVEEFIRCIKHAKLVSDVREN